MGNTKPKKKKTAGDVILLLLLLTAISVFCYAAYNLFHIFTEYKKGTDEYNTIAEMAVTEVEPEGGEAATQEQEQTLTAPLEIDFASLRAVNEDVIGWIYMEAIPDINYPVVQGSDNSEYLHTTYQGTYNFAGTIFIDCTNRRDFSDCNTIVYGHNMKNGSMFGSLKKFLSDEETLKSSKYFWILTPENNYRYEIVSAYKTAVNSETYTLFKGPGEDFLKYLSMVQSSSQIATNAKEMNIKDKIVTLSTCTNDQSVRFVVQGRLSDTIAVSGDN